MAVNNPCAYQQAGTYPASLDRLHQTSARFIPTTLDTTSVAARSGIVGGQSGRQANYNMTNWDVTIGRFVAVIENTFGTNQGDYSVFNDNSQVLTVAASSPTTNRIDIIGVRVQDAFYTGVVNSADLAIVQGTPAAGTPAPPTLPASFMPIVQVTVNAGTTTGVLTDMRKRTAIMGAAYSPFVNQLTDNGTAVGELQIMPAAGVYPARLRSWDGAAWRGASSYGFQPPAQSGSGTLPAGSATGAVIFALSVADPGYSYALEVSGALGWGVLSATSSLAHNMWVTTTLDSTTYNSGRISSGFAIALPGIAAGNSQPSYQLAPQTSAVLTGAHTVRLMCRNNHASDTYTIPAASVESRLQCLLVPA